MWDQASGPPDNAPVLNTGRSNSKFGLFRPVRAASIHRRDILMRLLASCPCMYHVRQVPLCASCVFIGGKDDGTDREILEASAAQVTLLHVVFNP